MDSRNWRDGVISVPTWICFRNETRSERQFKSFDFSEIVLRSENHQHRDGSIFLEG